MSDVDKSGMFFAGSPIGILGIDASVYMYEDNPFSYANVVLINNVLLCPDDSSDGDYQILSKEKLTFDFNSEYLRTVNLEEYAKECVMLTLADEEVDLKL